MGDLLTIAIGPRRDLRRGTPATAWYDLACSLERSDPTGAVHAYRRALAGRPADRCWADAHNNLGRLLHDAGDLIGAEGHYRLALCTDPNVALYWFNLGVVVEDRGRHAEAFAAYELALQLEPHLADAHYNLARLYELTGRAANDELCRSMLGCAVRHLTSYRSITRPTAGRIR